MSFKTTAAFDYVATTRISHYTYVITRVVLNTSACITINLHSETDPYFNKHPSFNTEYNITS